MKKSTKKTTPKKAAKAAATLKAQRKPAGEPKAERKPAADARPKRLSALDAAAQVLAQAGKPMRAQELIAAMAQQGLWTSPSGKTPEATLYAAMLREVRQRGDAARFRKADRGLFEFNAPGAEE